VLLQRVNLYIFWVGTHFSALCGVVWAGTQVRVCDEDSSTSPSAVQNERENYPLQTADAPQRSRQKSTQRRRIKNEILSKFPDSSLRKIVGKVVLDSAVKNIEDIECFVAANSNIQDIRGLDGFKNIETLSLPHNNIENIEPLLSLKNLKKLNLSDNMVRHCSGLAKLPLTHLNLSNNRLKYGFLMSLEGLRELDISNNRIEQLNGDLSVMHNLCFFDISNTLIGQLPRRFKCLQLEVLNISGTKISSIRSLSDNAKSLPRLHTLVATNCPFLDSITDLFTMTANGICCRLPKLSIIHIDTQYLNESSRDLLAKLRREGCDRTITLNGERIHESSHSVADEEKQAHIVVEAQIH
jgi:Leucine-rich repeat (LRR) protein